MTTAIIVGRKGLHLLCRCLNSLELAQPERTIFVANKCPESVEVIRERYQWAEVIDNALNVGFWQGLNDALESIAVDEPFCYFGQDVVFDEQWLTHSAPMFRAQFPSGLGLLTFRDGLQDGKNASHGMTTRNWLYVLYGRNLFPSEHYYHFHCDSELTNRSRDLGRYVYCEASIVMHKHEPSGFADVDRLGINDKLSNDARTFEWRSKEINHARDRLRTMP